MSNVIDLPANVKTGDPVRAEDYNKLLAALRSSIIQPGTGYLRTINKSGTTLRIKQNKEFRPRINPPFSVIEVDAASGNNYNLRLEPGRVCSANPVAAADSPPEDGYDYFIPEIDGTPMDQKDSNGDYPEISVEDGFSVYCKIKRSATGVVIPPVQIVAADRDEKSGHYFPPDPNDSGTEEVFQYRRILDLDVVSNEVEIKVWRRSDIDLEPFLWEGDNIGTGVDVFKEHNEQDGVYNFRRINACYGLAGEIDGDSVKLDFEGENGGESATGNKAKVYVEPGEDVECGDKAKFRQLAQGSGIGRQEIQVVEDGELVRISGNGIDATISFQDCQSNVIYNLVFRDGLLTTNGNQTIQYESCGSSP